MHYMRKVAIHMQTSQNDALHLKNKISSSGNSCNSGGKINMNNNNSNRSNIVFQVHFMRCIMRGDGVEFIVLTMTL